MFYIGYLAASYPMSLGFVKFPLGKYLSVMVCVQYMFQRRFEMLTFLPEFYGVSV